MQNFTPIPLIFVAGALVGLCPGPALTSLASLKPTIIIFVGGMIIGMYGSKFLTRRV